MLDKNEIVTKIRQQVDNIAQQDDITNYISAQNSDALTNMSDTDIPIILNLMHRIPPNHPTVSEILCLLIKTEAQRGNTAGMEDFIHQLGAQLQQRNEEQAAQERRYQSTVALARLTCALQNGAIMNEEAVRAYARAIILPAEYQSASNRKLRYLQYTTIADAYGVLVRRADPKGEDIQRLQHHHSAYTEMARIYKPKD